MKTEIQTAGALDSRVYLEGHLIQVHTSRSWFQHRILPLSIEQLRWRPDVRGWSVGQCLDHLNLTLDLYLPKIDDAIVRGYRGDTRDVCKLCDRAELQALQLLEPPVTVAARLRRRRCQAQPSIRIGWSIAFIEPATVMWTRCAERPDWTCSAFVS